MLKLLKSLQRGTCDECTLYTLVRTHYEYEAQKPSQVCVKCVPVNGADLTHESSKLVVAGY